MKLSSFEPSGIVTLLTDFGHADTYVGQMKGVLLGIDRALKIVDLTHDVPTQAVGEGAFQLAAARDAFPSGTVHVAVVDPGVGTDRRAIVLETVDALYIAPDNGLLSLVLPDGTAAYEITNSSLYRRSLTSTFHGRDVFAPIAGLLASGSINLPDVGERIPVESLNCHSYELAGDEGELIASIVSIDQFGNCITLLPGEKLSAAASLIKVVCNGFRTESLSRTYQDVDPGEPLSLVGSYGTLELSVRDGSAAEVFELQRGDLVAIRGLE